MKFFSSALVALLSTPAFCIDDDSFSSPSVAPRRNLRGLQSFSAQQSAWNSITRGGNPGWAQISNGSNRIKAREISVNSEGSLFWIIDTDGRVYYRYGPREEERFVQVLNNSNGDPFNFKHIAVSGDSNHVYGVGVNNHLYYMKWEFALSGGSLEFEDFGPTKNERNANSISISNISINQDGSQVWVTAQEGNRRNTYFNKGRSKGNRFQRASKEHPRGRGHNEKIEVSRDGGVVMHTTSIDEVYMRREFTREQYNNVKNQFDSGRHCNTIQNMAPDSKQNRDTEYVCWMLQTGKPKLPNFSITDALISKAGKNRVFNDPEINPRDVEMMLGGPGNPDVDEIAKGNMRICADDNTGTEVAERFCRFHGYATAKSWDVTNDLSNEVKQELCYMFNGEKSSEGQRVALGEDYPSRFSNIECGGYMGLANYEFSPADYEEVGRLIVGANSDDTNKNLGATTSYLTDNFPETDARGNQFLKRSDLEQIQPGSPIYGNGFYNVLETTSDGHLTFLIDRDNNLYIRVNQDLLCQNDLVNLKFPTCSSKPGCAFDDNNGEKCYWDYTRVDRYRNLSQFSQYRGKWVPRGNGLTYTVESSWETCSEESITESFSTGLSLTTEATVSSEFGGSGVEMSISSTIEEQWSEEVSRSTSSCTGGSITNECGIPCLGDGQQNFEVFEWITQGISQDNTGIYEIGSCQVVCVDTGNPWDNRESRSPVGPFWAINRERGGYCVNNDDWIEKDSDKKEAVVCCGENDQESFLFNADLAWNQGKRRAPESHPSCCYLCEDKDDDFCKNC